MKEMRSGGRPAHGRPDRFTLVRPIAGGPSRPGGDRSFAPAARRRGNTLPRMADVPMPRLSDSMEEGTILKWLKADGDEVAAGDELVEIETDKANMTYEAETAGVLAIVAAEGETLAVGAPMARIGAASANGAPPAARPRASPPSEPEPRNPQPAAPGPRRRPPAPAPAPAAKASPVARRMARELGVELGDIRGSGPGGRIVKSDIRAAAGEERRSRAGGASGARARGRAPGRHGQGRGTGRSSRACSRRSRGGWPSPRRPHQSSCSSPRPTWRRPSPSAPNSRPPPATRRCRPTTTSIVKAVALALREFPRANGAYRDGRFELHSRVNVGVAVAAGDALVVPTLFDADRKSLGTIAAETRALAERVRAGAATPPELSGGTFTVSNLGMYGMQRIVPVINPPQAAILGVGALEQRVVAVDGRAAVRQRIDLTLVCDHRILYGADAAQFLARIRALLEQPLRLAL